MTRDQKCHYVESILDFHFEGGFTSVIEENGFGDDEIDKWASMACLFECCVSYRCVPAGSEKDAFLLLEDLYTSLDIDISMGLGFDDLDLNDVGAGYDVENNRFSDMLFYALSLLQQHGLRLWLLRDQLLS